MRLLLCTSLAVVAACASAIAMAAPPVPSGSHPRLFMSPTERAGYSTNAQNPASNAAAQIAACQRTIDHAADYVDRGGVDANTWPAAAVECAFAYSVTQQSQYLTQALKYWQAALNDDATIGDGLACVPGVATDWQTWAKAGQNGDRPPIIETVMHDTGYPIRWYGPYVALTYDWLYNAPGVTDALRTQTRTCLTAWLDWYSGYGFDHASAGANYNAGFVVGKVLGGIAIGNDAGADGHLWTEAVDQQFGSLIIGTGLKGLADPVGTPAGALVGGDSVEGWQYGNLTVTEYAVAARALYASGDAAPELHTWVDSLIVRAVYGLVPQRDGQWVGADFDSTAVYAPPSIGPINAVLIGPSSDQAAAWALFEKQQLKLGGAGDNIYSVLAELRDVPPVDFRTQTPAPALSYFAHGSRTMYVRTSWDPTAFWGTFVSAPVLVGHEHYSASNFAFSRGADHLIVDSSQYGAPGTIETNAASADSKLLGGDYAKTQTPWSAADLPWARASDGTVFAARSDFAHGFDANGTPSDVPYAHREWVFLPEGEVVTIDRVDTGDASRMMYVNFHANSGGTLKMSGGVASGTVGGSRIVIHPAFISSCTPSVTVPGAINDSSNCTGSYPMGTCTNARFAVDIYTLQVPGPQATAVHVIDGLGASDDPATVASITDPSYDPMSQNSGVVGAAIYRSTKQSYVLASSGTHGNAGATLTYGVPGMAARHVVFDAPEASDGSSQVMAAAQDGRCVVTITAGNGGGFIGHPLMFKVDSADQQCAVMDGAATPISGPPPTPTPTPTPTPKGGKAGAVVGSACGCTVSASGSTPWIWFSIAAAVVPLAWRRRRTRR